jgi:hypothetical protein
MEQVPAFVIGETALTQSVCIYVYCHVIHNCCRCPQDGYAQNTGTIEIGTVEQLNPNKPDTPCKNNVLSD